jgi:phospholipid/cholesterol/gamma-HCH transport system permease protein
MAEQVARLSVRGEAGGGISIVFGGSWRVASQLQQDGDVSAVLAARPSIVRFEAEGLEGWDSALVSYVARVSEQASANGIAIDRSRLPEGVRRLLDLAEAGPVVPAPTKERRPSRIEWLGLKAAKKTADFVRSLAFLGEASVTFARMAVGRARFRRRDLLLIIQRAGAQGLWIISLVAFLVGLILAFVGSVQLKAFGATIYIADLVGIAMVRELGAVMAAIVAAGRTGAAFAAELGTMRVTQEIDAFVTLGISPMEFLVVPRIVALTLMLPVLCLYADLMGILGGAVVAISVFGIEPHVYYIETIQAVTTTHLFGGVFKAAVYGCLVAAAGCYEGLRSGRSASAVGLAATAAVVDGIVLVIVASGILAVVFYFLGI